jgi:hypothetical protein
MIVIVLGLAYFVLRFSQWATHEFYVDSYHNKMLVTYEYTRRVLSDVYVAVTNNIYYIEHNLDNPDSHKDVMVRIVKNGTRVRSCGISFIENYYPQKGRQFCPYAWRNPVNPDVVTSVDLGDTAFDYLSADWFRRLIENDTTQWSDPFYDGYEAKTPLTAYMAPIHDQEGRTVAVLGADVSLDWLTNKLSETDSTINKNASFISEVLDLASQSFIVNHDGTFITHPEEGHILKDNFFNHIKGSDDSDVKTLTDNLKNGSVSEEETHEKYFFDNHKCYVFYTPIKYTRWMIITVVPCQSIDILGYVNGLVLLLIIAFALFIIVFIGYYYLKSDAELLKMLTKSANDMVKGKVDEAMPDIHRSDEIGQLRDALDKLQYALSNRTGETPRK